MPGQILFVPPAVSSSRGLRAPPGSPMRTAVTWEALDTTLDCPDIDMDHHVYCNCWHSLYIVTDITFRMSRIYIYIVYPALRNETIWNYTRYIMNRYNLRDIMMRYQICKDILVNIGCICQISDISIYDNLWCLFQTSTKEDIDRRIQELEQQMSLSCHKKIQKAVFLVCSVMYKI